MGAADAAGVRALRPGCSAAVAAVVAADLTVYRCHVAAAAAVHVEGGVADRAAGQVVAQAAAPAAALLLLLSL